MKLLIVEDEAENIETFQKFLQEPDIEIIFARSKASGILASLEHQFDLVILDLRIPSVDDGLDADASHGLAVWSSLKQNHKAPQTIIFSAHADRNQVGNLLNYATQVDFWGNDKPEPEVWFLDKTDYPKCIEHILFVNTELRILNSIKISTSGQQITLDDADKRLIKRFARLSGGAFVDLGLLGGGLSIAKTLRVDVKNGSGEVICRAAVKLGPINKIRDEHSRYTKLALPNAACGLIPYILNYLELDCGEKSALYYGLAIGYEESLLDVLFRSESEAIKLISDLSKHMKSWNTGDTKRLTVRDFRKTMGIDDDLISQLAAYNFDWQAIDNCLISIKLCPQHGDLHGLNILVKEGQNVLLIDFGETARRPACLDPLVLELCLVFHPACRAKSGNWPSVEQASSWNNLDQYLEGCPFPNFVQACRDWAYDAALSDEEVFAMTYCHAARQMKYNNENMDAASAIAKCAASCLVA